MAKDKFDRTKERPLRFAAAAAAACELGLNKDENFKLFASFESTPMLRMEQRAGVIKAIRFGSAIQQKAMGDESIT